MSRTHPRPPAAALLYADEDLLVVDKPPGFVVVASREDESDLPGLLRRLGLVPADEPFRLVHRIDKETSGVTVYARTLRAQQSLSAQFEDRRVTKTYLALVQGYVPADGEVDLPLLCGEGITKTRIALKHGKPARTQYRIVERLTGHTLLACHPRTGRHHQIRVHLAEIGHPLAVDPVYGGGREILLSAFKPNYRHSQRHEERPLIERLTLHAASIAFEHPAGTGVVTFEAPLPKDLRATLNQLRRLAPPGP